MSKRVLVVVLALACVARPAFSTTPTAISVQGVLRNGMGQLQTIPIDLKVQFFNGTGTSLAGPYTKTGVVVVNGLFNLQVEDPTIGALLAATTDGQVFLEVTVNSTDVFPRQRVTSEVFALQCGNADSLGGKVAAAYLTSADAATTYQPKGNYLVATAQAADSASLGGVAATSWQKALTAPGTVTGTGACAAGSVISGISQNGTFQCTSAGSKLASCYTKVTAFLATPNNLNCNAGDIVMGGGCDTPVGQSVHTTLPNGSGGWLCCSGGDCTGGALVAARVICCPP